MTLLTLLLATTLQAKPQLAAITGHRHCAEIPGSIGECPNGPRDAPAEFTYEVTGNRMKLDTPNCEGKTLRYIFHFGEGCAVSEITPEMGKPDLLFVISQAGCSGYYRCVDLRPPLIRDGSATKLPAGSRPSD